MPITSYELVEVVQDYVTADKIVWYRYKRKAIGIVEAMLDYNPHLAVIHQTTPFIPPGTFVMVPIDPNLLGNAVSGTNTNPNFWGGNSG